MSQRLPQSLLPGFNLKCALIHEAGPVQTEIPFARKRPMMKAWPVLTAGGVCFASKGEEGRALQQCS